MPEQSRNEPRTPLTYETFMDWLLVELRNVNAILEAQRAQLEAQRKEDEDGRKD